MKVRFLGGANEVGASCVLVSTRTGRNILLDCGVRVNEAGTDMLPNLEPLNDVVLDAIIISHAHLDHSGALPVVAKISPGASIYATAATKDLARVLLYDAIKVAEFREGLRLYDADDAEKALDRTMTRGYGIPFEAAEGVQVEFLPAGHILGAASILVQTDEGTLLYTGDFTTFDQETVGIQKFSSVLRRGVDVVITEGTYGSRLHGSRAEEVRRLLGAIAETVVEVGGRVLVPAFAVGRAQEIILALRNYIRRTKSKIPVYVDGLIRNVNGVFAANANYLAERYRKEVLRGCELFYTNGIDPLQTKQERDRILVSNEPCVIIASSGMLTGGVSPIYAERLVQSEKNLLAIVGYQDEESPGRKLLELADKPEGERKVVLNDAEFPVNCRVERYGLSAHADAFGIVVSVKDLRPRFVLLNHGNEESLAALAEALAAELPETRVEIAQTGDAYNYAATRGTVRRYSLSPRVREISLHREGPVNAQELWNHLVANGMGGTTLSVGDLVAVWSGDRELPDDERQSFRKVVAQDPHFAVASTNPNAVYVLTEAEYIQATTPQPLEQNVARALVQERLAPYGVYRIGFSPDGTIILYFPTLRYAERCADVIQDLERETLRRIEVMRSTNTELLKTKVKSELLQEFGIAIPKDPSFGTDAMTVRLPSDAALTDELRQYAARFEVETGIELLFRQERPPLPGPEPSHVSEGAGPLLEQNAAKRLIEDAFQGLPHKPKVSIYPAERRMGLSFISPYVGTRYEDVLHALERATGWRLEVLATTRVNELVEVAKELLRSRGMDGMKVGVHDGYVEARGPIEVDGPTSEELRREYLELTGFNLRFRKT